MRRPRLLLCALLTACLTFAAAPTPAAANAEQAAAGAPRRTVAAPVVTPLADWSDGCPTATGTPQTSRRLVVHHTHKPVAERREDVPAVLNQICRGHLDRGFKTVGYHYLVDPWGGIWQGRGVLPGAAVAPAAQVDGAHAEGFNTGSVGVALIGDFEDEPPSDAALRAATGLMTWLASGAGLDPHAGTVMTSNGGDNVRYEGGADVELAAVSGHRDTSHTGCPGEHLYRLLPQLRDDVAAALDAATVAIAAPQVAAALRQRSLLEGTEVRAAAPRPSRPPATDRPAAAAEPARRPSLPTSVEPRGVGAFARRLGQMFALHAR